MAEQTNKYAHEPNKRFLFQLGKEGDIEAQRILVARLGIYTEVMADNGEQLDFNGQPLQRHSLFNRDVFKDFYQISPEQAAAEFKEAALISAAAGRAGDFLNLALKLENKPQYLSLAAKSAAAMDGSLSSASFLKYATERNIYPAGVWQEAELAGKQLYQSVLQKRRELGLAEKPDWRKLALDQAARTPCPANPALRLIDEACPLDLDKGTMF